MERTGSLEYCRVWVRGLRKRVGGLIEEVDEGRGEGEGVRGVLDLLVL